MQSGSDAPVEGVKQLSVAEINCPLNGKENCMTAPSCLQEKQALQNAAPQGQKRSKLPVLSKAKEPPDFQKMHQTWQTHFQKGKAVCKKSCTRPQPFNFSQRGERPRRPNVDVRTSMASSNQLFNSSGSYKSREPLAEVILRQNKKESSFVKGDSEVEFKSDPSALASILSNTGVSTAPVGKVSLAQRVPMRGSSNTHPRNSNNNLMIRNSMFCVSNSQIVAANLDRMSCFSKMTVKATEQKPPLRPQNKNPILETTANLPGEQKKEELHPQENAVLQQMNPPTHIPTSDKTSCLFTAQDDNLASLSAITDQNSSKLSTHLCKTSTSKLDESTGKKESEKKTDNSFVDFVADSHSLANILSNTEINNVNCGKLSLAQRVPMQGRSSMFKGAMPLPGFFTMQTGTPKSACGPMSNVAVPLKELMFSPCRVPLVTSEKSSGASARRAFRPQSSTMKFPQHYSATSKQPVFPKTPRALALEKANKCLEADKTDVPTSLKSTVKWADELSPSLSSEVICEREPDMEEVAMRLFLDGEGPEEPEKKKEPTAVPDPLTVLESPPTSAPQQNKLVQPDTRRANVGDSQNIQLHSQMHLAPLSQPSASYSSASVACLKPSVPLSFLAHPAVKALQSSTLGPCSLPDIARLRLQAAVSAKQRFWEARLDEECAFYISRGASGSNRSCRDPVSLYLEKQEDMHFTPICSGES